MAHDNSQDQGAEHSQSDEPRRDDLAPLTVNTTDPVIESVVDHPSDWKLHPEAIIRAETSQRSDAELLGVTGVRTVVIESLPWHDSGRSRDDGRDRTQIDRDQQQEENDPRSDEDSDEEQDQSGGHSRHQRQDGGGRGKANGHSGDRKPDQRGRNENRGGPQARQNDDERAKHQEDRSDDRSRPERQPHQPSMTKILLLTAGIALVSGVIGAMGYSYFFGSKSKGSSSDQSQNKSESGSSDSPGSSGSSGGSSNSSNSMNSSDMSGTKQGLSFEQGSNGAKSHDSGKKSTAHPSATNLTSGFPSPVSLDMSRRMTDLLNQIERLNERVEGMSRSSNETPPELSMMQVKIGELARDMGKFSELPAQIRQFDSRLANVQEQVKSLSLRMHIDAAQTDPIAATTSPIGGSTPGNPTIDLGISQLERAQYASARDTFLRLQVTQPDDARVWYLSALAEGLTSGNWDGKAKQFAEKGLERERAGHPSTASVDVTLATGTAIKGEAWIASLRAGMPRTDDRGK